MLEELSNWLVGFLPLEQVDLYQSLFENLRDLEDPSAETEFVLLWNQREGLYSGELLDSLRTILHVGARKALGNYGVVFRDETPLYVLSRAIEGILWIGNTEDKAIIDNILNMEISDNEKIARLFQYANGDSLELWMNHLAHVSSLLMENIQEDINTVTEMTGLDDFFDLTYLTRFEIKYKNNLYRKAIDLGIAAGTLSADNLIHCFLEQISTFIPFSPTDVAESIVGLVLFSDAPKGTWLATARSQVGSLTADESFKQALLLEISKTLAGIQIYE
jgi:hypothetical protein